MKALIEGIYFNPVGSRNIYNNTYKGLRLVGDDYSIYYSVWCTNEAEFYDVKVRRLFPAPEIQSLTYH